MINITTGYKELAFHSCNAMEEIDEFVIWCNCGFGVSGTSNDKDEMYKAYRDHLPKKSREDLEKWERIDSEIRNAIDKLTENDLKLRSDNNHKDTEELIKSLRSNIVLENYPSSKNK